MVKDKDKLFIECECADRCSIVTLDYLECTKKFYLNLYRLYSFKRKKEIYGLTFIKDQAQKIIGYLQKKRLGYMYYIYFAYKTPNFSGGLKIEWRRDFRIFYLGFTRKYKFNREKEIYALTFSDDQAQEIIAYLQNKLNKEGAS